MPELKKEILAGVSRSFYVTLKLLPKAVRDPLSLGYLLARAADTIADTDALPAQERLACLKRFEQRVCDHAEDPNLTHDLCAALTNKLDHPEERLLLERLDECLSWFDKSPDDERKAIETVLRVILKGQSLDVERFELESGASALPDAAALDEYTYFVAGCVGEFWTNVPFHKLHTTLEHLRDLLLRHAFHTEQHQGEPLLVRERRKCFADGIVQFRRDGACRIVRF